MKPLRPRAVRQDPPQAKKNMVSATQLDSSLQAVIKWIPVEVIAAYEVVLGLIPDQDPETSLYFLFFFVLATPLWIGFSTANTSKRMNSPIAWRQVILACVAFAIWALGTQTQLMQFVSSNWQPWKSSVALVVGALLLPIIDGFLLRRGLTQN